MRAKGPNLWTKNFIYLNVATILGMAGGIAGEFAISILVFDETGSTFASVLVIAIAMIPQIVIPLIASPIMDRFPRKPALVWGDFANGILYGCIGLYFLNFRFSYIGFLWISLIASCLGSFDTLAYMAFYPKVIPQGCEEKGYTISSMLYPVMRMIMMPFAAVLVKWIGVGWILIIQSGCSFLAAVLDNQVKIVETIAPFAQDTPLFSPGAWFRDLKTAGRFIRENSGFLSIFSYVATSAGVSVGVYPIQLAFFRVTPGFSIEMFSVFTVVEMIGRTIGGVVHYNVKIPPKRRYSFAFFVYQFYEIMDMLLLWIPYPFMLINRTLCGFLGINSATLRERAVQSAIPEDMRARINAFHSIFNSVFVMTLSLFIGWLGEIFDYRVAVTMSAGICLIAAWFFIGGNRKGVSAIYNKEDGENGEPQSDLTSA